MRLPDVRLRIAASMLAAVVVLAGCSRLTFIRPDLSRGRERTVTEPVVLRQEAPGRQQARALVQAAQSRLLGNDAAGAANAASLAVKADPKSAEAHSLLALSLDRLGRSAEAGPHHRTAAELSPRQGGLLNNYGTWLCSNGQVAASLDWLERAAVMPGYETPDMALANAAACALQAGQGARAERNARAVLEIAPANPLALSTLARVMFASGRGLEARAFVQRRLSAAPADVETLQLASQIEQSLGDTAAASRYVQRIRAEFPRDSDAAGEGGTP